MKKRCVHLYIHPRKARMLFIASASGAILLGIPALILHFGGSLMGLNENNAEGLFAAATVVAWVALFFLLVCASQLWTSLRRYEIGAEEIFSYEPFRKKRAIPLAEIADLYVVVHTSVPGMRQPRGHVIRDVEDDSKIIYYVILLRAGCPARLLVDDMSYFMRQSAKKYILYDFVYDRESVWQILDRSNATLHTDETMFYYLYHDEGFAPFRERMKCEELNRMYGDLPFER